jgi:flavin-binding protein dodecin
VEPAEWAPFIDPWRIGHGASFHTVASSVAGSRARYVGSPAPVFCQRSNAGIANDTERGMDMAESVYKIIELVGTSTESWEKAVQAAVDRAGQSLEDLRVAEVSELDVTLSNGKVEAYRAKVKVSFKYKGGD